jgi:DNA processing protein
MMLKGVGSAALKIASSVHGYLNESIDELALRVPAVGKACRMDGAWDHALADAEQQVEKARQAGARIISQVDDHFPLILRTARRSPFLLYVRGVLRPDQMPSVAIIGTRQPTLHGAKITERITAFFVDQGWSIVSGLALGCDSIAHRAALVGKGHTLAVLAHGLQTVAPSQNQKLADEILAGGGALVSEFAFGIEPLPPLFVKRDATQAGLAHGVIMIQSDLSGGSLHASRAALEYGRWLAVPYPTEMDRKNVEPKISANLVLGDTDLEQKAALLKCDVTDLSRLFLLRGREDYSALLSMRTTEGLLPGELPQTLL